MSKPEQCSFEQIVTTLERSFSNAKARELATKFSNKALIEYLEAKIVELEDARCIDISSLLEACDE